MNPSPSHRIVRLALIIYLPMMGGIFFLRPPGMLKVVSWSEFAYGLAAACAAGVVVIAASRAVARRTDWGQALQVEFRQLLGQLTSGQILVLALLSGFGEEILFRGVIHAHLGLWMTALLFGAFHFPYRRLMLPWSCFALLMGVVLGLLTTGFNSLWPAILLHFLINYFNLHDLAQPPVERPNKES